MGHRHTSIEPAAHRWAAGTRLIRHGLFAAALAALALVSGCERSQADQRGYRGTGMYQIDKPSKAVALDALNAIPEPEAQEPPDPEAPQIKEVFKNVQVLNDLTVLEFSRLMQALSTWVAPDEGCDYCHNPNKLESDEKYPKVVARRMLQMTREINTRWKQHVGETGVTCWTCHRGQAVPSGDWFALPHQAIKGMLGNRAGQNQPGIAAIGNTSLPSDPLSAFLTNHPGPAPSLQGVGDSSGPADDFSAFVPSDVRIQGSRALAGSNPISIQNAEWSYAFMIYVSNSLGVNCDYCHNTRAMGRWEQSLPQRATAWYGIRMARHLNSEYLKPVAALLPANRLSAEGDGPKVGCMTCHKGTYKPLYGKSMLQDYPELAGAMTEQTRAAHAAAPEGAPPPTKPSVQPPSIAVTPGTVPVDPSRN